MEEDELRQAIKKLKIEREDVAFENIKPEAVIKRCKDLASRYPQQISTRVIGKSRENRDIYMLKIGGGDKVIAAVANNHAEEVMGTFTTLYLADQLVSNQELNPLLKEYQFLFVPQANPDGMLKNWGWMKNNKLDFREYVLNKYRDLRIEDVEHGIPFKEFDKETGVPIDSAIEPKRAETKAIKEFINYFPKMDYYLSLHGNSFGSGASFYCFKPPHTQTPKAYAPFNPMFSLVTELCEQEKLPMDDEDKGGYEGDRRIQKGFHTLPPFEEMIKGKQVKLNSVQYSLKSKINFAVVTELPLFYVTEFADTEKIGISRYDIKWQSNVEYKEICLKEFEQILKELSSLKLEGEAKCWFEHYCLYLEQKRNQLLQDRNEGFNVFKTQKAYRKDLLELYLSPHKCGYLMAGAAMKILENCQDSRAKQLSEKYKHMFDLHYNAFANKINIKPFPLEAQVKLQTAVILGGTLLI
jgi:hypothetical protein